LFNGVECVLLRLIKIVSFLEGKHWIMFAFDKDVLIRSWIFVWEDKAGKLAEQKGIALFSGFQKKYFNTLSTRSVLRCRA